MRNRTAIFFCILVFFGISAGAGATPFSAIDLGGRVDTQTKNNQFIIHKTAVLGRDDRRPIPKKYLNVAASIGILGQPGRRGWSCSAFCVAEDIVATNAHCIVRNPTAGRRLDLARSVFVLPPVNSKSSKVSYPGTFAHPVTLSRKQPGLSVYSGNFVRPKSVAAQNHDWAFTKLNKPVCKGRILKFATRKISALMNDAKKSRVFMIGFHGDKKMEKRLYSSKCRIRSPQNRKYFLKSQRRMMARSGALLPHTCDAFKGSSGSPILLDTDEGVRVIGINLGSLRYERYKINRNPYTGKVIGRKKIQYRRETNMAVRPSAFLAGLERYRKETLLQSISDFKRIQTHLKALKLYKGKIDGRMGQMTRRAIVRYEQIFGLPPIALPTRELLKHLGNTITKRDASEQSG